MPVLRSKTRALEKGSKQFQGEYIDYLQERNNELLNKLSVMKENYENKIFSKDINKQCLMSMLEDVLNVCTTLPQEIDLIFDKMTSAMTILKNVLIKKSQMIQLADKISKSLNLYQDSSNSKMVDMCSVLDDPKSDPKAFKRGSTAKVSPMINGHVILTPRICLSRVSRDITPKEKDDSQKLSPIIEASPETSSIIISDLEKCANRELRIPLERINYNKLPYKVFSEGSPKSRFQGPKIWKKSLSSKKGQTGDVKNTNSVEEQQQQQNKNVENERVANNETRPSTSINDEDPLEGPSWLYDDKLNPPGRRSARYLEFRRRKRRFASVFDKNDDLGRLSSGKKKKEKSLNESQNSSKNETNETSASENFISESFNENKENSSTSKGKQRLTHRKYVEDSEDEDEINGFEPGSAKKMSTPNRLNRSIFMRPYSYSLSDTDSSSDEEIFNKSSGTSSRSKLWQGNGSMRKSRKSNGVSKSMNKLNGGQTPRSAKQKKGKNSKIKSKSSKKSDQTENQNEDKREECETLKNDTVTKKSSVGKKKGSGVSCTEVDSCSPVNISQGRAKRKAAPANLTEPNLQRKLRRD